MSFSSLMKDTVSLLKKNGEKTDGIKASVQKRKIFINRSDVLIETGDLIQRKMSNGGEETYEVIDPGFYERHGGIPAHYQMDVKKIELSEAKKTTQNEEIKVDLYADSLAKESKNLGYVNTGAKTIFISHANEDAVLARAIKTQIDNVFEKKVNVFVSSITISPGSDWFDKILSSLTENDAFIVLVTSYSEKRPFVWFEIGFSWLRRLNNKCEIYAICAPPIDHGNLPEPLCRLQAISLAEEDRTIAFFEKLTKQFKLGNLGALKFAQIRDSLPTYPSHITQSENIDISYEAKTLLIEASKDTKGDIIRILFGNGTTSAIQIASKNMVPSQEPRIIAKWEQALNELLENDFIEVRGLKREVFTVTYKGYEYADTLKKDADVLQDKSSAGTSASVQQYDLEFEKASGTYISKEDGLRYCHKCLHSSSQRVPLKEQKNGWRCSVCDNFYANPNYERQKFVNNDYDRLGI